MLRFRRLTKPTLDLDDIQATVLRSRPAPYYGTHTLIEIVDAAAGREAIRRLRTRVTSAARWHEPLPAWTAVALTYPGLQALRTPTASLESFPVAFGRAWRRVPTGSATTARIIRRGGSNPSEPVGFTWR